MRFAFEPAATHREHDVRVVRRFLLLPLTLPVGGPPFAVRGVPPRFELRWLERAAIRQVWRTVGRSTVVCGWVDECFDA